MKMYNSTSKNKHQESKERFWVAQNQRRSRPAASKRFPSSVPPMLIVLRECHIRSLLGEAVSAWFSRIFAHISCQAHASCGDPCLPWLCRAQRRSRRSLSSGAGERALSEHLANAGKFL